MNNTTFIAPTARVETIRLARCSAVSCPVLANTEVGVVVSMLVSGVLAAAEVSLVIADVLVAAVASAL